jgi:hypothetical protein
MVMDGKTPCYPEGMMRTTEGDEMSSAHLIEEIPLVIVVSVFGVDILVVCDPTMDFGDRPSKVLRRLLALS